MLLPKTIKMSVPDEGFFFRNASADGLLVPKCIISPEVVVLTTTWFIRFIYYRKLQFLNCVIMIRTKVLLPQTYVTLPNLEIMLRPFSFLAPKDF